MGRLKMLVLTVIATMAVGTGVLTAAPSASARPPSCGEILHLYWTNYNVWSVLVATGYGETQTAATYKANADGYLLALREMC